MCTSPIEVRTSSMSLVPCGQCTMCRVKKSSGWQLRNHLELTTSLCATFVTLTISDPNMKKFLELTPLRAFQKFVHATRTSERRAGNPYPIRYFASYEYGETFGRPHFHLLLFNSLKKFPRPLSPYEKGQIRNGFSSKLWPFGSVDIGDANKKTIRYISNYLLKGGDTPAQLYTSLRPGIGSYGAQLLGTSHAKLHGTLLEMPNYLTLGNRTYPVPRSTQGHYLYAYRTASGLIDIPRPDMRKVEALIRLELKTDAEKLKSERYIQRLLNAEKLTTQKAVFQDLRYEKHAKKIFLAAALPTDNATPSAAQEHGCH